MYGPGSHTENYNVATSYLKQVLGFLGITDVKVVLAGGTSAIDKGQTTLPEFVKPFEGEVVAVAK